MTKLHKYQREGVCKITQFDGRALLADDMGLGKTLQALKWAETQHAFPMIVICPAGVKYHWQEEARKHLGIRAEVLEGRSPPKQVQSLFQAPIIILNYEILGAWLSHLQAMKAKFVVVDECQRIKNTSTQCWRNVRSLCKIRVKKTFRFKKGGITPIKRKTGIRYILGLSGTPILNYPIEVWPILHLINPRRFKSRSSFGMSFCRVRFTPWGPQYKEAKNTKKLHKLLHNSCMIRRLKQNVISELPDKTRITIPVKLPHTNEYNKAAKDFLGWLKQSSPEKARRAAQAERLVKVGYLCRLAAQLKLPLVYEWIDDFLNDSSSKLVVFGVHKSILLPLRNKYKPISELINGDIIGRKRTAAINHFRQDKKCRLMFANVQAAGTGVDGLQVADTELMIEFPWSPGLVNQAESRIHRIGQKGAAMIYNLVAKDTIEVPLVRVLQRKQEGIINALDRTTRKADELDIYDQVISQLNKENGHVR